MGILKIVSLLDVLSCKIKSLLSPLNIEVEYSIVSSHSYPLVVRTINMCFIRPKNRKAVDHGHRIVHVEVKLFKASFGEPFAPTTFSMKN